MRPDKYLTTSQRSMIAARLANLDHGGQRRDKDQEAKLPLDAVTTDEAASQLNVSERSVKAGRKVVDKGTPDVQAAVDRGEMSVNEGSQIADLPPEEQDQRMQLPSKRDALAVTFLITKVGAA